MGGAINMRLKEKDILNEIFKNLKMGNSYGYHVHEKNSVGAMCDYDHDVLYRISKVGFNMDYIGYCYYGSSATRPNISSLAWVIKVVFQMTPKTFIETYDLLPKKDGWCY